MSNEMIVTLSGGKRVTASYDGFEIATDQPVKDGGGGTAPQPYDLFLASLATCAGYYVLSFCTKRGIPTDDIRIVERWDRDDRGGIETITIRIELPESFPEKYHGAVVRAANLCSVKKTIEDPPEFVVETAAV